MESVNPGPRNVPIEATRQWTPSLGTLHLYIFMRCPWLARTGKGVLGTCYWLLLSTQKRAFIARSPSFNLYLLRQTYLKPCEILNSIPHIPRSPNHPPSKLNNLQQGCEKAKLENQGKKTTIIIVPNGPEPITTNHQLRLNSVAHPMPPPAWTLRAFSAWSTAQTKRLIPSKPSASR